MTVSLCQCREIQLSLSIKIISKKYIIYYISMYLCVSTYQKYQSFLVKISGGYELYSCRWEKEIFLNGIVCRFENVLQFERNYFFEIPDLLPPLLFETKILQSQAIIAKRTSQPFFAYYMLGEKHGYCCFGLSLLHLPPS